MPEDNEIRDILAEFENGTIQDVRTGMGVVNRRAVAEQRIKDLVLRGRIREIELFREAMLNHSTPMAYAPDRIKLLESQLSRPKEEKDA